MLHSTKSTEGRRGSRQGGGKAHGARGEGVRQSPLTLQGPERFRTDQEVTQWQAVLGGGDRVLGSTVDSMAVSEGFPEKETLEQRVE